MELDKMTIGVDVKSCKDCNRIEPTEGRWVPSEIPCEGYVCSECGGAAWYYSSVGLVQKSRFCPNCGSYMRNAGVDDAENNL